MRPMDTGYYSTVRAKKTLPSCTPNSPPSTVHEANTANPTMIVSTTTFTVPYGMFCEEPERIGDLDLDEPKQSELAGQSDSFQGLHLESL